MQASAGLAGLFLASVKRVNTPPVVYSRELLERWDL